MERIKEIRKNSFLNGLGLGALLFLSQLLALYFLGYSQSIVVIILAYSFSYFIIPVVAAILLIIKIRRLGGGYWTLRQATSGIFILFLTAYVISSTASFVYGRYIQPKMVDKASENFVNVFSDTMGSLNADQDKIDEFVEMVEQQSADAAQVSIGNMFTNMVPTILILFLVALIFAAIFKKEHPVTANQQHQV